MICVYMLYMHTFVYLHSYLHFHPLQTSKTRFRSWRQLCCRSPLEHSSRLKGPSQWPRRGDQPQVLGLEIHELDIWDFYRCNNHGIIALMVVKWEYDM